MALEATGYVPFPRERVWERFARPGGITRLIPGFMGLRVLQEARPLSSGTAILQPMPPSPLPAAPFVPKWVAQHDSSAFVEGERFLDRVESAPYKQLFGWAHDHRLEDVEGGTQVVDILHGRIPERLVAPMFAFRRVQLTEDL